MTEDKKNIRSASLRELASFLKWAEQQHGFIIGRVHVHSCRCYGKNNQEPGCGYVSGDLEPVDIAPESLASMFVHQETITCAQQSALLHLAMDARSTELKLRRGPTEQDIMRALNVWQPHPDLSFQKSACLPGTCFCCDAARALSENAPFIIAMRSIAGQVATGETEQLDALVSAFIFGALTAEVIHRHAQ